MPQYKYDVDSAMHDDGIEDFIKFYDYHKKLKVNMNNYIHSIAIHSSIKILRYLIAKKVKLDFDLVKDDLTPIMRLVKDGKITRRKIITFKLLLEKSSNPFQVRKVYDKDGNLDLAFSLYDFIYQKKKLGLVLLKIIDNFVDTSEKQNKNFLALLGTGFNILESQNKENFLFFLKNNNLKGDYRENVLNLLLNFSIASEIFYFCDLLLKEGANIDNNMTGKGPLLISMVKSQKISCVKFILKNGGNVNIQDKDGNTALHYAYFLQLYQIKNILINKKASFYIKNKKGKTYNDLEYENTEN